MAQEIGEKPHPAVSVPGPSATNVSSPWGVLGPILAVPMLLRPGLCKMGSRAARQTATQGPISKFTIRALAKVVCNRHIKFREKPDRGGSPDVAISPDVVSFVHDSFGDCDLRWGSGIGNVAREASSISLATGTARKVVLLHRSRR
jgi:hypothetical protein